MNHKYSISVIFPVYNERATIVQTIKASINFLKHFDVLENYELIVVDDGSRDGTTEMLMELSENLGHLKIITLPKNLGYGGAMVAGFEHTHFPWILMMDADGQFNVDSIKDIIKHIPHYDIITGYRNKRRDSLYRIILGKTYTFFVFLLFGIKLNDVNCGFKLIKRKMLNFDHIVSRAGAFYTNIFIDAMKNGYRIKEVPIQHFPRTNGKQSGGSLKVICEAIIDVFRLKFSKI